MIKYDTEYEKGELKDKKGVVYSVRTLSIESMKNWVWLLYEPASESDTIGHFFPIPSISQVLGEGEKDRCTCSYCPMCLPRFRTVKIESSLEAL